jgi:hypothetical protein
MRAIAAGLVLAGWAGVVAADLPPAETATQGDAQVTIYAMNFLTEQEVTTLRLVLTNPQALAVFVPEGAGGGHAALAVSPEDGFIRDGAPVPSATAIAGLDSADAAATAALDACNAVRKGPSGCVVVLQVAPAAQ